MGTKKKQLTGVRISRGLFDALQVHHKKFGKVTSQRGKKKQTFSNFIETVLGDYCYEKSKVKNLMLDGVDWDIEEFD